MFESQLHGSSSFITLTYDEASCPFPPSLDYSHFQKFMKRLRKSLGPLRFFVVGEYGPENGRPHFHACIFGTDFSSDRYVFAWSAAGNPYYRSPSLEKLWPFGFSSVCDLTFESAAYVARYSLKKVTGDLAQYYYRFVDADSGEVSMLKPEFCRMSLKPGIGGQWFDKYYKDVYSYDYVVVNGHKCRPPRYFDKLFRRLDRINYDYLKSDRSSSVRDLHDLSDARLLVRERVHLAALQRLSPRGDLL
nr:MAG: replication initiator protein [Microvirus sp.]QJB19638.1 MAG: replication initiator protein [Microvirus sp.]